MMKLTRTKIKKFRFKDNFNIDYSPYYKIECGIYSFQDFNTKLKFMSQYGITCQCERKIINSKLVHCYNDIPISKEQKEFLRKRALVLSQNHNVITGSLINNDCGCKKKKRQE